MTRRPASLYARGRRLIWRSLVARPVPHAVAIAGAIVFAVAAVALTRVLGRVTDELIVPALDGDGVGADEVWKAVGAIIAVGLLRGTGAVVRRYYLAVAEYGTERVWRRQLFEQYLRLPLAFLQSRPTGELLAHADNDMSVAGMVLKPLAFTLGTLVLLIVALVSLLFISPWLALIGLVLFPALMAMNRVYTARVEHPSARVQQAVGDVSSIAHESFDGALVVKVLGREAAEVARMRRAAAVLREERIGVGRLRAAFEPAIDALPNIGIVALLAVGAWLVDQEAITVGELVGAMALFTILGLPMRVVGFFLEELPKSVVALDRIDDVLRQPTPAPLDDHPTLPHGPLGVAYEDIGVHYGRTVVLDSLSFAVEPGESVAVVGATGEGKSTLARLLVDLQPPDHGRVLVGGHDVAGIDPAAMTDSVALVFQESFLFADSVRENIALGRDVDDDDVRRAAEIAAAVTFIGELAHGYDSVVGERGVTLSGGQRQRVALARALVGSPRVLFLDDATSAIDPTVEARILGNLRRELHVTLIVVAHRLSTIRLADRVVFLSGGRIAATGSHDELLQLPAYETLVRAYEQEAVA